jgi:Na+/H+ antiporter NhaC
VSSADYSSILIVGAALSPLLPAMRTSREKFALIVHAMGGEWLASCMP